LLNLDILTKLLNDRALRGQVSRLIAGKVRADAKSLELGSLLSRQLLEMAARRRSDEAPANEPMLRELIKEHLDYYETLVNQMLTFNQRMLDRLQGLGSANGPASAPQTMRLRAPLHATLRAPFRLENNRTSPIAVGFEITPFVSESGAEFVSTDVAFDPPSLELKPGQEARIDLVIAVAQGFTSGTAYYATITVKGLEHTQLLVRLQVDPPQTEVQPAPPATVPASISADANADEDAASAPAATKANPGPRASGKPAKRARKGTVVPPTDARSPVPAAAAKKRAVAPSAGTRSKSPKSPKSKAKAKTRRGAKKVATRKT
jgi:hypothetical protein